LKNFLITIFTLVSISAIFPQTTADEYNQAMTAYNNQQYVTAVGLFDNFFSDYKLSDELFATAKYYYSDALLNTGEKFAAASGFEFIVNNFSWSAFRYKALYKLGIIYFEEEEYDKSRKNLQQLLNEYPETEHTGSALYWIGESYTEQNRLKDAISFLEEAVNNKKNNKYLDYSIFTLANTYEKTGEYDKAVKYYDRLLSYHQNSPLALSAQLRIGVCYFKLKDYQSSILELNNPRLTNLPADIYSESLYLLGNSYYRLQEYNNAEKTYNELLQKFPASDVFRDSQYGLAWTYFQQKKYGDAYNIFNILSTGDDSLAIKSFYWKAESKRYAGKDEDAFKIYNEFLNKYPGSELANDVRYQLGGHYFESKNYITSESYLNAAANSDNPDIKARAQTMLGEISLDKKDYNKAADYFYKVIALSVKKPELINRAKLGLGTTYYFNGNYEKAIEYLNEIDISESGVEKDKINFYLGESFYAEGKYQDALKYYLKVDSKDSSVSAQSLYGKAYCYFNQRNFENAANSFSDFVKKYPDDKRIIDVKLRLADSYYGSKDYSAASRIYKNLFAGGSASLTDPYGYYQFAQALYKAGSIDEAINEFNNLQQRFPESQYAQGSLFTIGWIYFQKDNFNEAILKYRNLMQVYPNSSLTPLVYYSIGDAYFNQAKYDSAIINYEKVVALYPSSNYVFDAVNGIQYCYVAKNEPSKAIALIDNFVSKNPGLSFSDQLLFKKGEIYYSMRDYEKAEISYKEFVSDYPSSKQVPDAYYWIGKSAQNLNQNEEAVFNFKKVFGSYPNSEAAGAAVLEIGNIYNVQKDYDSAIEIYNKAIDKIPKSPRIAEIVFMKGVTYSNKQDPDNAYSVFQDVVQYYSGTIFADKAKLELGMIELSASRYSNAEFYFKNLAESRADDIGAKAQYFLGVALAEEGNTEDAIDVLEKVRTVFSAYDEWLTKSYMKLGDLYTEKEDYNKAKEYYRAVLTKHKGDQYGHEAQDKLRKLK
jgi:TolA-binding protein